MPDPLSGYDPANLRKAAGDTGPTQEEVEQDLRSKEEQADWWKREKARRAQKKEEGPSGIDAISQAAQSLNPFSGQTWPSGEAPDLAAADAEAEMRKEQAAGTLQATAPSGYSPTQEGASARARRDAPPLGTPGVGTATYDKSDLVDRFAAPKTEAAPAAPPQAAPRPTAPSTGGGSASASSSFAGQIGPDFNEQIAAMEREKDARAKQANIEAAGIHHTDLVKQANAIGEEMQSRRAEIEGRQYLDDIKKLTHAYADGTVDEDKWWHDRNVPQKIAAIVGAGLLGFGGHPEAALNQINVQIDRSIALQQDAINRNRVAAGHAENLYGLFRAQSKSEQEAYDKTRAALLDSAMSDAIRAGVAAKSDVQKAQMDQFIAQLKQQRDSVLMKLAAAQAKGSSGGGNPAFIPLENGAATVTLKDGTELYVGQGGAKVAESITTGERAAEEADELANMLNPANIPNPLTHFSAYQDWVGAVREKFKSASVLGASHLAGGGRGNVSILNNYRTAMQGPEGDPKGWIGGLLDYPSLVTGRAQAMVSAVKQYATGVRADIANTIKTHNVIVGHQQVAQAHGTGEFKGQTIGKPVFVPSGERYAPKTPEQEKKADPTAPFVPNTRP